MDETVKNKTDREDVLNILQTFGKYQIVQYLYICLPTIIIATGNVNYIFVAGDVDYRCRVAECESVDNSFSPFWWPDSRESLGTELNRCYMPISNETYLAVHGCDNSSFTLKFSECKEWVYRSNNTIVSWLNLGCNPWKVNMVGTIHSFGAVLGMTVGGALADRFGRKSTFIVAALGITIGNIKTLIWSYYGYLFIELLESISSGSAFAAVMILIVEISGNNQRMLSGVIFAYAIYLGEALLVGIAVILHFWKWIIHVICLTPILFIFYIYLLEESPRWLVLHNRFDDAKRILKLITKSNKINMDLEDIDKMDEEKLKQTCNVEMELKKEGYKEALSSKEILKRLLIMTASRFSITLVYYGLLANSVLLPGNKYTNYTLTTFMSFPGDILALYFMNKWGRRMPLFYGYFICGVACISSSFVPDSYTWLKIIIYLIAKLTSAASFTGIWTYTMELFPTSIRGSMFGLCTLLASPGCMLAPLAPAMDSIYPMLSSFFFASSTIGSSVLILFAPETKDQPLSGTIQDIINSLESSKRFKKNGGEQNYGLDEDNIDNVRL